MSIMEKLVPNYKKCKCKDTMKLIATWDNPELNYAFNLYACDHCGMIMKQNVWDNAGELWVAVDNQVEQ